MTESLVFFGTEIRRGTVVRLRPRGRGGALDLRLTGRTGMVDGIEQDCQGGFHLAILLDGLRLFFDPWEIEP